MNINLLKERILQYICCCQRQNPIGTSSKAQRPSYVERRLCKKPITRSVVRCKTSQSTIASKNETKNLPPPALVVSTSSGLTNKFKSKRASQDSGITSIEIQKGSVLSNVTEEKEIIRSKSSDEGIGLNSTFESLPFIDDEYETNSDQDEYDNENNNTESKMLINPIIASATSETIKTCLQTNLTEKNNVETTKEEREIMIDISGAQAQHITSINANIKTWQKFTKQIIVAKKRFKNQDEKKQMKKVWKENYTCMVSHDKFVNRIAEVSVAKPATVGIAKVKLPSKNFVDKEKEMKKYVIGDDVVGKMFPDRSNALADAQIGDQPMAGTVTLKAINSYCRFNIRTRSVDVFLEGPMNLPSQILDCKKRCSLHLGRALQLMYIILTSEITFFKYVTLIKVMK